MDLSINARGREREREREKIETVRKLFIHWFTAQMLQQSGLEQERAKGQEPHPCKGFWVLIIFFAFPDTYKWCLNPLIKAFIRKMTMGEKTK